MADSLGEALPRECARVRKLMLDYRALPGGVGMFAISIMEQTLRDADQAMISQDTTGMINAYQRLKEFE
jgi:hypothetical protein